MFPSWSSRAALDGLSSSRVSSRLSIAVLHRPLIRSRMFDQEEEEEEKVFFFLSPSSKSISSPSFSSRLEQ